ncbi:hypothetical protein WH52_07405 [Tenacibaculum holothuriorum]|uniref:Potassium channel domain-containing protein n=1 Tax=Tenacibaculum holothuriorum TaxID=1635173 RepID=A0A1Y2PDK4_9FLAO|nr:potassium channel family protein [Tenacibaculum holothuriorum]OSY88563.1 hypothetical protein WH52_07405 [Tenacibaculum holothuriorum]
MKSFIKNLYKHRFEIFLSTQLLVLFGSLLFPLQYFENVMMPIFLLLNITSGILMVSKNKVVWLILSFFFLAFGFFGLDMLTKRDTEDYMWVRLFIYFFFYIVVTWHIIKQVWAEKQVDKKVILGLMSGYISLGFLAFFLFLTIELWSPGSFAGTLLDPEQAFNIRMDSLMYYAYITLLTIGYGEIVPITPMAQKAAILIGLVGQFYIAIITAVVIEKYIRHTVSKK